MCRSFKMRQTLSKENRPDANGVPIQIPGTEINLMKVCGKSADTAEANNMQSGPLRPVNTLHSTRAFALKSVSRNSTPSNGDGPQNKVTPYFTSKVLRKKAPGHLQASNDEGPPNKKRRVEGLRERSMSRESPIVIDDDVEMDEQDELALSSDRAQVYSVSAKKHSFTRLIQPANKTPLSDAARISEYHSVENMMSPSKSHIYAAKPLHHILQSNDSHGEDASSKDSSEDELFTKMSKQQRLEAKAEAVHEKPPEQITNGDLASAEAGELRTPQVPEGIFYSSPAGPANGEAGSPDVLQVVGERTRSGGRSSQVPLHQATGSTLAKAIIHGTDISPSQIRRSKLKATNGKASHPAVRDFRLRQLRFGPLPQDFDYIITIHEDYKTLSIRPQVQILPDEMTGAIPLRRVSNIHHGENGCTKVMLVMSRAQDAIDDKMHLELESDKEVYDFVRAVQRLAGGKTSVDTKPRHALSNPPHVVIANTTQFLATECFGAP
jgi:hypothetical protein